jgi:hypothetical protein
VPSLRDEQGYISPRSVSNWRKGASLPAEIEPILRALFGPVKGRHEARETLRAAFLQARAEMFDRAKRDPAGAQWVVQGDQFAIDRTARPTDQRAAADKVRQQLQLAIRATAAELAEAAQRLANSRAWVRLSPTAAAFRAVVEGDPLAMPDRLGEAYALLLRLGRFLETDIRVQRDPAAMDGPLDADIHGLLTDLVRTAAPWLRGFPTVAAWDDAAGKALVRADLFQPASDFTRIARRKQTISARDAAEIEILAEAADATDFQGQKAGSRAAGDVRNLMLAAAETVATFLSGAGAADLATRSLLVQRAGATLAEAEAAVEAFARTLPDDLRHALLALTKEGRRLDAAPPPALSAPPDPPVPQDVEHAARELILAGRAPPAAWRPSIRKLDFARTRLGSLNLLSGLTDLQSLYLRDTPVSDVEPLSGLTALQHLDLTGTPVSDVGPLSGLTDLQSLNLNETRVSDVGPLSGLTALQSLNLTGTRVSDVGPLPGLTALQHLYLGDTEVSDVGPLSGLTDLQDLYLRGTRVSDVGPLSGLTALQCLDLAGTRVSDVGPLSALTALQRLDLRRTRVDDVSPLAHLHDLEILKDEPARHQPSHPDLWTPRSRKP